ncbi:Nucleolar GTP-binding protein 1 [Forsythia ovata]|uniref:Nucleolar GTP-binding protein 1 n=1 Tax=Forsythia ovata TaxID=205694 RepID=A0ABD1WN58_9LAMI
MPKPRDQKERPPCIHKVLLEAKAKKAKQAAEKQNKLEKDLEEENEAFGKISTMVGCTKFLSDSVTFPPVEMVVQLDNQELARQPLGNRTGCRVASLVATNRWLYNLGQISSNQCEYNIAPPNVLKNSGQM